MGNSSSTSVSNNVASLFSSWPSCSYYSKSVGSSGSFFAVSVGQNVQPEACGVKDGSLASVSVTLPHPGDYQLPRVGSSSLPAVAVLARPRLPAVPALVNSTVLGMGLERVHDEPGVDPLGPDGQAAQVLLPRDGPLGQRGESLSLTELKNRSHDLLSEFAWNSLAVGSSKVYK